MKQIETWAQVSTRKVEPRYVSLDEHRRLERVAVGRICWCNDCICCAEFRADKQMQTGKLSTY